MKRPGIEDHQNDIGERFQEETKYTPDRIGGHYLDWEHMPERYKSYPEAAAKIKLPDVKFGEAGDLWEIILRRRSVRNYSPRLMHRRNVPSCGRSVPWQSNSCAPPMRG